MYSNYSSMPISSDLPVMSSSFPSSNTSSLNSSSIPYNSYSSMPYSSYNSIPYNANSSDDRILAGGFLGPFLLGGITGGLLAPAFYPRPYNNNNYYYPPYYYGPYYR